MKNNAIAILLALIVGFTMMPANTDAASKNPAEVKGVKVTKVTKSTVTLSWGKTSRANGYHVYKKASGSKKWSKAVTTKSRKATVKKLKSGKKYSFKVRAYAKKNGKKIWGNSSAVKTVRTKSSPEYRTIRRLIPLTTGGDSEGFGKAIKAEPKGRKVGKYYFLCDENGLCYWKGKNGKKTYISKKVLSLDYGYSGFVAITNGKTVFYQKSRDGTVYRYNISKKKTTEVYDLNHPAPFLIGCYENALYICTPPDGPTTHYWIGRISLSTGKYKSLVKTRPFAIGESYGRYLTAHRNPADNRWDTVDEKTDIFDLKTGKFKKIDKHGVKMVLTPQKKAYYYKYETYTLYSCSFTGKNKKRVAKLGRVHTVWMSDSHICYANESNAYKFAYKRTLGKTTIKTVKAKGNKITITWKKAKRAKKYEVWLRRGNKKWKKACTTSKLKCTCKCKYNTKYRVKVRAINGKKKGKFSKSKKIKTGTVKKYTVVKKVGKFKFQNYVQGKITKKQLEIGVFESLCNIGFKGKTKVLTKKDLNERLVDKYYKTPFGKNGSSVEFFIVTYGVKAYEDDDPYYLKSKIYDVNRRLSFFTEYRYAKNKSYGSSRGWRKNCYTDNEYLHYPSPDFGCGYQPYRIKKCKFNNKHMIIDLYQYDNTRASQNGGTPPLIAKYKATLTKQSNKRFKLTRIKKLSK